MTQTKEQFLKKVDEMTGEEFKKWIMEKAEKAFTSGAISGEDFEDNYLLPKIFMSALGEEIKFQYKPLNKKHLNIRNNLQLFL